METNHERIHIQKLIIAGVFLFFLGLLNGMMIPLFTNPKLGLSAHLSAMQHGIVLILFGLIWNRLKLSETGLTWCYRLSVFSMYGIWIGLVLGAAWGTISGTPMAGAGFGTTQGKENIVDFFLNSGAVAILIATIQILFGLFNKEKSALKTTKN